MTEPSQYFKGRTVQEQMDEVIGYVDKRAEEVAAAKADDVLQPAEAAKTAAQAAQAAAEDAQAGAEAARNTTLAALPDIQQDISDLRAENVALDGRLNTVELKVQTAEGNIVTIQGKITAIENKNAQQDSSIAALQTADGQNVKINDINQYAVGLTGNQGPIAGMKIFSADMQLTTVMNRQFQFKATGLPTNTSVPSSQSNLSIGFLAGDDSEIGNIIVRTTTDGSRLIRIILNGTGGHQVALNLMSIQPDGTIKYPWS